MYTQKIAAITAAAFAALAFSAPASAVLLQGSTGSNANTVTDYSTAGVVSFDLALNNFASTRLDFVLEAADLAGPLSFNALVSNLVGLSIHQFNFGLQGISYAAAGSVSSFSGAQASYTSNEAVITFANGEPAEFMFGNPTGVAGRSDWLLDTTGLAAGDTFSIVATQVPEPSTVAMMLPLLAGLLLARRRRQG